MGKSNPAVCMNCGRNEEECNSTIDCDAYVQQMIDEAYEGPGGYYGVDKDGNQFHTWDFEESIGE